MSTYGRDYGRDTFSDPDAGRRWGSTRSDERPAPLIDRCLAFLVDTLILAVPAVVVAIIGYYVIYRPACDSYPFLKTTRYDCSDTGLAALWWWLLVVVVSLAVAVVVDIVPTGRHGQSVGKYLFGVKVVGAGSGEPVGPMRAALRFVLRAAVSMPWLGAGCWWAFRHPRRQAWHDLICETEVVAVHARWRSFSGLS